MFDEGKYFNALGDIIEIDGQALSLSVISIIARRMGMIDENTTYAETRAWLASDNAKVHELLRLTAQILNDHVTEGAEPFAQDSKTWAQQYYEAVGIVATGKADEVFNSAIDELNKTIDNLCDTSVIGILDREGTFQPFDKVYKDEIDNIIRGYSTGQNTADEIKKAAQRLSQSGLRVEYASGRTMNIYSAIRQTAISEIGRATQDMRTAMGYEYGADGVEISAHGLCAPDHLPYQGRQYTREEFDALQSSLERPIARGYNCRHTTRPIIVGVSIHGVSEELRQKYIDASNREVTFVRDEQEHSMTAYEATQYQRQMENSIRKAKMTEHTLNEAGIDTSELSAQIDQATDEYLDVSEQMGIRPQSQRLDIYELSI